MNSLQKHLKYQIAALQKYSDLNIWKKDHIPTPPLKNQKYHISDSQIKKLLEKDIKSKDNDKTLYLKRLSPSCRSCMKGQTACLRLTYKCTENCFYCSCPEKIMEKSHAALSKNSRIKRIYNYAITPHINGRIIRNDKDLIEELKDHNAKCCGISGGEPLLLVDKAIYYIKLLKNKFGNDFRIHLYTNGKLCNTAVLIKLKKAGLDEVRFDLTGASFNYKPVELARKIFKEVAVEIPAIPGEYNKLKNMINKLEQMNVKYLNFHELYFTQYNIESLKSKGYIFKYKDTLPFYRRDLYPVFGSEETALKLLKYSALNTKRLCVHYCSSAARLDHQIVNQRKNIAFNRRKSYEKITNEGLLEKGIIYGLPLNEIKSILKKLKVPNKEMSVKAKNCWVEVSPKTLKYIKVKKIKCAIISVMPTTEQIVRYKSVR